MKRQKHLKDLFLVFIVLVTATVHSLAVLWFLEPANLISIGLTGLSQILNRSFSMIGMTIPVGVFTLVLNVPLCIYGAKTVSPRFVLFSILSVLVQSFWLLDWDFLKIDFGFTAQDRFFLSVIGGLFCGCSIGVALRYGTSTGGMDIIGQALALRKNISIGFFSTIVNILLAVIAGGLIERSWTITLYTFVFIIVSNLAIDKIHTAYNYLRIDIISLHPDQIADALIVGIHRGCTILDVKGAYTKEKKADVFMIISSYELQKVAEIVRKTDPMAFMTVSPIKRIFGKFFKHTII
ncbi:MAG TPA: YitT family protein [Candidatus Pelethenecus faecipullorum]|uniref:YitT family protein n=1 Tax=Candidatus Pelethenecus faecipullorum TaxID=2840900 RepID=A0A9D1GQ53_9MOLU|nr:YitT family protein [Candidatus Pelethenecus faecipullorum]